METKLSEEGVAIKPEGIIITIDFIILAIGHDEVREAIVTEERRVKPIETTA